MTIVGVAGEGARPNHQAALVGHGDVGLDSELMGFAGFALADAFDFRCMQGVELVLVLRLLPADAFGPFEQCVQVGDGTERCTDRGRQFAFDFAQHDAEDGALAPDGAPQGLELFGVGVAAGLAAQFFALFHEGLLQGDADALGGLHDLGARDLQQAAIDRMGDGFLLDSGVDNDPFELRRTYGLGLHGRVDGRLQQFFHPGFANGGAKAPNLGGIAGKFGLVVVLTTEVLLHHVLRPAGHQFLVTQVEGVLEIEQRGHQPDRQTRPAYRTDPGAGNLQRRPEQVAAGHHLARPTFAGNGRGQSGFDLGPRQPTRQHCQGVPQINHLIESGSEKVVGRHLRLPQISLRF